MEKKQHLHFVVKDEFLEIDTPHLQIPWENVIEIKFWDKNNH